MLTTAQSVKSFTHDSVTFLNEVSALLIDARKKEGKDFIDDKFTRTWYGGKISEQKREKVYEICDFMLKKRMKPFPDFESFLFSVVSFVESERSDESYRAWMESLEKIINSRNRKKFTDYLAVCNGLFSNNTLFLSASTQWRSSNSDYIFKYDSLPVIEFPALDLRCFTKGDSAVIYNTKGVYYPTLGNWVGQGGKITWERAGQSNTVTFAEIGDYKIRLKGSSFEADSAILTDPYFEKPLMGKLSEKVLANMTPEKASYPRFESYDRRIGIKNIVKGVDFEGGFSMHGAKLKGYGTKDEKASLTFYREKKAFLVAKALSYTIDPKRISTNNAEITFYLEEDSIYHPSLNLRFMRDNRKLTLTRKDEGVSQSPFYNSFHELDMFLEAVYWNIDDPLIQFGSLLGSTQNRASFESLNYYKEARYMALQGIDVLHPLIRIKDHIESTGSEEFYVEELARSMRLQKRQVIPMVIDLANKGYLNYDTEEEWISVKQRLYDHIQASAGNIDYDVLQFNSSTADGKNATLSLLNYDLILQGVRRIILSDSQSVKIYPAEQMVTIKKNRDFNFAGVVQAGKLHYFGKEYAFKYDPFMIDLINVDSVSIYADRFENDGSWVRVKNVIEQIQGTLEIDLPTNKSGLLSQEYPGFPVFTSNQESYVFYDNKRIQKGVYGKDRFYFQTEPFQLDSLDDFSNVRLNFDGTLVSAGIFPDLNETLVLQRDYSLGFTRTTETSGLPLYAAKAHFTDTIRLNYNGLQGSGHLAHLTANAWSKEFVFCPDSTIGVTDTLYNVASVADLKVPGVNANNVFVRLEPATELLHAEEIDEPLMFYNDEAVLHGYFDLMPSGMTGAGMMDFTNATLKSDLFKFETMITFSDTANFELKATDTLGIAFKTDDVNATIRFDERVGEFVSNGDETVVEFPVNQYICFMDRFKWYMDDGDIELESDRTDALASSDLHLSGSNFISINPDQDSLRFMAPKARYDLKAHTITATEVEYINVADAFIYPDSGQVIIRKRAKMDQLTNARVLASYVNKFHNIYNASVNINARRDYTGSGDYDYIDEVKRTLTLHFDNINVDTSFQSYAQGTVIEEDAFQLSPHFDYIGKVRLDANKKFLSFTGNTRILHDCPDVGRNWMGFKDEIDPNEVFIPVADTLLDEMGQAVGAGILMTHEDPFKLYGSFLSNKLNEKDKDVIVSAGYLFYDQKTKQYQISNKEKIRERSLPGNFISLDVSSCDVNADGRINLGIDNGQVKYQNVGTVTQIGAEHKIELDLMMVIDFFFDNNALELMAEEINTHPDLKPIEIGKTQYEKGLKEIMGLEKSDKLISDLNIKGEIKKMPADLEKSLVFAKIKLEWDEDIGSYVSKGKIGISNIGKKQVFKYVEGKVELTRKRSGDILNIWFKLDDENHYYFQYMRNYMYGYSTNKEFNTILMEVKEEKRALATKKDEPKYQFMLTNRGKFNKFRERYE